MVLKTKRALKAQRSDSVTSISSNTQALFEARNRQLGKIINIKRALSIYSSRRNSADGCNTVQEEPKKSQPNVRPTSYREEIVYKGNVFDDKDYTQQLRLLSLNAYKPQRTSSFSVSSYSSGSPTTPPMTRPEFIKSTPPVASQPIDPRSDEHPEPQPRKRAKEIPQTEEGLSAVTELSTVKLTDEKRDDEEDGALLGDLVNAFPFLAASNSSRPPTPKEGDAVPQSSSQSNEKPQTTEDTTITSGPADALDKIIRQRSFGKKDPKHNEAAHCRVEYRKEQAKRVDDDMASPQTCSVPEPMTKPVPTARKYIEAQAETIKVPQPAERKSLPATRRNLPQIDANTSETSVLQISHERGSSSLSSQASPLPTRAASMNESQRSTSSSPLQARLRSNATTTHHSDSRLSTPSPRSEASHSACVSPQPYLKISEEFRQVLREKGIDISSKPLDPPFMRNNRDKESKKPRPSSQPIQSQPTKITSRHIRQKSRDEVLLDSQVESLRKSLKDFNHVFASKGKNPIDYLPGVFDDILAKNVPRRSRTSRSSTPSPEHCSTNNLKLTSDSIGCSKKDTLLSVLKQKLTVLQHDTKDLEAAVQDNTEQGQAVQALIEERCDCKELEKYSSYVAQIEKVTALLLRLSRRLAKAENALTNVPSDATDDDKKLLEQKKNGLLIQHTEAKQLKEEIDENKLVISATLNDKLEPSEFQLYENYISDKLKLAVELNDLENQITLCKHQINAMNESA